MHINLSFNQLCDQCVNLLIDKLNKISKFVMIYIDFNTLISNENII